MNVLITGGAGYIGSVVAHDLISEGYSVIVIDNLSKGKKSLVPKNAVFIEDDLEDIEVLRSVFKAHKIGCVMHFAAAKDAGESMINLSPYTKNITCFTNLLRVMNEFNCEKIIFSSSAAVYGLPEQQVITENHSLKPINYYGFSKLECERILEWYESLKCFIGIKLRYFNVAGDAIGYVDPDAKNIFPVIAEVITKKRKELEVFGNDYETKDGTCVRDYVDIRDLSKAHVLALKLERSETINIGTSKGYSVLDLIKEFKKYGDLPYKFVEKRKGDPAFLVCSNKKAQNLLGWQANHDLKDMVKSTMEAYK